MNFHSAEDFLIAKAFARTNSATVPQQRGPLRLGTKLPLTVIAAAQLRIRVFPVFVASKFAADSRIKERISQATCDLAKLEELASEKPAFWAIATGPGSVFAIRMEGELGEAAFKNLIALSVASFHGDAFEWLTLSVRAGTSRFALYKYPAGMAMHRRCKYPLDGLTLYGDRDYALMTPDFVLVDSHRESISPAPQFLLALAFEKLPDDDPSQPPSPVSPQSVGTHVVRSKANPTNHQRNRIKDVRRQEFPIRGTCGGWGGKTLISRRR